jgi:hypothetical protein
MRNRVHKDEICKQMQRSSDLVETYILLGACSIVVLVLDRFEKVQSANLVEKRLAELRPSASLGRRSESLGTSHKGKSNDGRSLHVYSDVADR